MLSYKQYLAEKISDIVFHKTHINNLVNILKTNRFRLSAAIGTKSEVDLNKGKMFYFSTARSPQSSYINSDPYIGDVYLMLDGVKLNQQFKGEAVDYWGKEFNKREMEDRIFTDKQNITNAKSYIKEIHILYSYEWKTKSIFGDENVDVRKLEDKQLINLKDVYTLAKKSNIPIYVYDNPNYYITRNKNKALNVMDIIKGEVISKLDRGEEYNPDKYGKRKSYLSPWIKLLNIPFTTKEDKDEHYDEINRILDKRTGDTLKNVLYYDDALNSLSADIHNSKSKDEISKLTTVMKKLKLKTSQDIIDHIKDKFSFKG